MVSLKNLKDSGPWDLVGVSPPELSKIHQQRFMEWLQRDTPPGLDYIKKRKAERLDPRKYMASVKSILVFGEYYYSGWAKGPIKVSNYAWDDDYHLRLRQKCQRSLEFLQQTYPKLEARICVDTSPHLEKILAVQAGIGWQGKNTLLLNEAGGSQYFLATLLTDLPLSSFEQTSTATDRCGSCRKCIEACPTDALQDYQLDAHKCISYWNLEHKTDFDSSTPDFQSWIAGCDICQEVCPWNSKLIPLDERESDLQSLGEKDFADLEAWTQRVQNKSIAYLKPAQWPRNLAHLKPASD